MKKIFLMFSFCIFMFASDATTTIVNEGLNLPKIIIQDASNLNDKNLQSQFFKLILGDLKVGATFDVDDGYYTSSYDGGYSSNLTTNPSLIVRYELDGDVYTELVLKIKVIDGKSGKTLYESNFSQKNGAKFPFLAHNAVSEIVKNFGYSDVDWMNKMLIYAVYTSSANSSIFV